MDMMIRTAKLSECGTYRYLLTRMWNFSRPTLVVVMLNPSTADALRDDNTIRKVVGIADRHGYGSIKVMNLRALRATDPRELLEHPDPMGPENNLYLSLPFKQDVLLAWGSHEAVDKLGGSVAVTAMLRAHGCRLYCLGRNKDGQPKHPLYLRNDTLMTPFEVTA